MPAGGAAPSNSARSRDSAAAANCVNARTRAVRRKSSCVRIHRVVAGQQIASVFVDSYGWFRLPDPSGVCASLWRGRHAHRRRRHDQAAVTQGSAMSPALTWTALILAGARDVLRGLSMAARASSDRQGRALFPMPA
jgi:hypothetical protein